MKKNKENFIQWDRSTRLNVFLTLIIAAITVLMIAPLEIYLTNVKEFWFTLKLLVPILCLCTGMAIMAMVFIFWILEKKLPKVGAVIFSVIVYIFWGMYIQGNFIINQNGVMDGHKIDWTRITSERIISAVIWCFIAVFFIWLLYKKKFKVFAKISRFISVCILLVAMSSLFVVFTQSFDSLHEKNYITTTENQFQLSKDENFIILILDAFDGSAFEDYISTEHGKEILQCLDGFNYYPDITSNFGHTELAIPDILTGIQYKNNEPYYEYLNRSYQEGAFINSLFDKGYDLNIYTDSQQLPPNGLSNHIRNYKNCELSISSKTRFIKYIYYLVGFRYAPYEIKKYFWFEPKEIDAARSVVEEFEIYTLSNANFYSKLNEVTSTTEKKQFQMYHINGVHQPYTTTIDFQEVAEEDEVTYEETREANIGIVKQFLRTLEEKDLYDNSVIIIMADHGKSYCNDKYDDAMNQNPLFMIKGKNERHKIKRNDMVKLSYCDLPYIFQNLLEQNNEGILPLDAYEKNRKRIFYKYKYYGPRKLNYMPDLNIYEVLGHAWEIDKMKNTGEKIVAKEEKK